MTFNKSSYIIFITHIFNVSTYIFIDQQIGQLLQRDLLYAYQDFTRDLAVACNYSAKVTSIPINVSFIKILISIQYFIFLYCNCY